MSNRTVQQRANATQVVRLDPAASNRWRDALLELPYPSGPEFGCWIEQVRKAAYTSLPVSILSHVTRFVDDPLGPQAIWIKGLPQDFHVGPTPRNGERSTMKTTHVAEGCAAGLASLTGSIFAYIHEKGPNVCHDICPTLRGKTSQTNESSETELLPHTELAALSHRPSFLCLYCIRSGNGAATVVYDRRATMKLLSPWVKHELKKKCFYIQRPESMGKPGYVGPLSVVSGSDDYPKLRLALYGMHADSDRGERALEELHRVLEDPRVFTEVCLAPGEALLLSNDGPHGRRKFESLAEGEDRWLIRAASAASLREFPGAQDSSRRLYG